MSEDILKLLEEWSPQFLTIQELVLLLPSSPTVGTVRRHVARLQAQGKVRVDMKHRAHIYLA